MAKTRDIVIGVIIGASFLVVIFFMGLGMLASRWERDSSGFGSMGDKVAIINIYGIIDNSSEVVRQLKRWGEDGSVKAIVLHLDTPGGIATPAHEIYEQVLEIRAETEKPVIAAMGSVCASGGYYIACACDRIVANPSTLTGSIGVIFQYPIANKLMEKIGLEMETVISGSRKDVGSPYRPVNDSDRAMLKALVDDTYEQFVEVVAEGRQLPVSEVRAFADGSVFSGRQAQKLGMVDTLGTFEDAVDIAGELAGIGKDPQRIRERPRRQVSFFDLLGQMTKIDFSRLLSQGEAAAYPQLLYQMN